MANVRHVFVPENRGDAEIAADDLFRGIVYVYSILYNIYYDYIIFIIYTFIVNLFIYSFTILFRCVFYVWFSQEDARHGQLKTRGELVASCHACSVLSDEVILAARRGRSPLVLVPCCYQKAPRLPREVGWPWLPNWSWKRWPWLEEGSINAQGRDAIHAARVKCLEEDGYEVWEEFIDPNISKMNMAIVAQPT